ncbi:MAG: HYR domain-containing protein [Acidobacteria bacterium]|nr:HYR domain-containing protein [Acidobacteriota bacterium]
MKTLIGLTCCLLLTASLPALAGTVTINFDSVDASAPGCVPAAPYLAGYGVTITGMTPATTVGIASTNQTYGGLAMQAPSMPNFLTQCGSNDPVSYTLHFWTPLNGVAFTRPRLLNGPSGISFPEWSVHFLDSVGNDLGSVGEPLSSYFADQPAKTFTFTASAIAAMRVESNNYHFAAFSALLLDDLTMTGPGVGVPTVTLISNDAQITGPSAIATDGASLFVGNAVGGTAQVLTLPIGGGTVSTLYSPATPCCVAALTVVGSNVFWIDPNGDPDATAIFRGPTAGGGITKIYSGFASGQPIVDGVGITTDGAQLYTTDDVQGRVHRLNTDGSAITFLGSRYGGGFDTEHSTRIAYDGDRLYVTDIGKAGVTTPSVLMLPATGGSFTTLASGAPLISPDAIAVGNGRIYVADAGGTTVWQLPQSGGTPAALVSGAPFQHIQGLVFYNNALYVTDAGGNGVHAAIYRIDFLGPPLDTTAPTTTATASPASNTNGWNHDDVTVSFNAIDNSGGSGVASVTYAINAGAPVTVSGNSTSFTLTTEGATTVTYHADDAFGNVEGEQLLTIKIDKTKPFLSYPSAIVAEATHSSGATVNFSATASDGLSGISSTFISHASGTVFPLGTTTVNFQATDFADNLATGSFTVTVQDTTPPMLSIPFGMTKEATGPSGATVFYTASATDIVDGSVAISCGPASGQVFALGVTTVSCSASDSRGHTNFGSFTVAVTDMTPPSLSLPSSITGVEATGPSGAHVTFNVSATDLIDGSRTVNCNPNSGSTFAVGTTTVFCSSSDSRGNQSFGSFTVMVRDTTAPSVSVPANITKEATGPSGALVTFTTSATDIVDGSRFVSCSRPSGSIFSIGTTTVTCTASDNHGNSSSAGFTVTVQDTTAPTLFLPSNIRSQSPDATTSVPVSFTASSNDIVDGRRAATCDPASGSLFPVGVTTTNCSVTDAHGNTATGSFTVTVVGLASIDVTTDIGDHHATLDPGQTQQFIATATFTDGSMASTADQHHDNGGGGSGGSWWSASFSPGLNVSPCSSTPIPGGFSSQTFTADSTGAVHTQWSPSTLVVSVDGTMSATHVDLTLTCLNNLGTPAHILADWQGTFYDGAVTFNGTTSHVTITGWSSKASMPTARFSVAGVFANGKTYAVGGDDGVCAGTGPCNFGPLKTVESYNLSSNTWSTEASMRVAREGAGVAALGGLIYAAGGHTSGGDATDTVEVFDGSTWTLLPSMSTRRAQFALVAAAGRLYAIGGENGSNGSTLLASVESYTPGGGWSPEPSMAVARKAFAAGVLNNGGTIVVAGGVTSNGNAAPTELYNIGSPAWTTGAPMPSPGAFGGGGTINNVFYVVGANSCGTGLLYMPSVSGPNGHSDGWALMPSMLTARNELGVAVDGSNLYAIGGQNAAQTALATLEVFSAPPAFVTFNFIQTDSGSPCSGGGTGGDHGPSWRVLDETIATIDPDETGAVVTAVRPGTTMVVAEFGSVSCLTTNTCATLTVRDVTPPVLGAVSDIVAEATSSGGAVVNFGLATATDDFDPAPAVSANPPSGSLFPLGSTTVTVTATDASGNSSTETFTVTVRDTTPPMLTLDGANPMTVEGGSTFTDPGATAVDAVDGNLTSQIHVTGTVNTNVPGTYVLTYTVSDRAGNTTTKTRTVNIVDTTAPVIGSATPSTGQLWPPNHKMVPISIAVTDTDAVDPAPACSITGITSNEAINGLGDGDTAPDWQFNPNSLLVNLRAERGGKGSGRIYTITVACADKSGNIATKTTFVTVPHDRGK